MLYKLFAFDLDGTLLAPDGTISAGTRVFLQVLRAQAQITLVTGRSLASAYPYILALNLTNPVVLYHGAVIWDPVSKESLVELKIPLEEARCALSALASLPVHVQVYIEPKDPTVYVTQLAPSIVQFLLKERLPAVEVQDLGNFLSCPPIKLLVIGQPKTLALAERQLYKVTPTLSLVRSERTYLEVLPRGVSKGAGLDWLCTYLGIKWKEVVAVGDQMSDLTMIERAGLGVAMAHAPAALRKKADLVVSHVEEIWDTLKQQEL